MRSGGCKFAHYETLWLALHDALEGREHEIRSRIRLEPATAQIALVVARESSDKKDFFQNMMTFCENADFPPSQILEEMKRRAAPKKPKVT